MAVNTAVAVPACGSPVPDRRRVIRDQDIVELPSCSLDLNVGFFGGGSDLSGVRGTRRDSGPPAPIRPSTLTLELGLPRLRIACP
jgi:hypothetical protein